jgi:hypothetical protein
MNKKRGSEKLMAAWKSRVLTEEAFREITTELEKSPATVEKVNVIGGEMPTGMQVLLSYSGDDIPVCGNDLAFWLRWRRKYGGLVKPPKIIINGIPYPDLLQVQLDFGHVGYEVGHAGVDLMNELNELTGPTELDVGRLVGR